MSYSSVANSAEYKPSSYPYGAIGSTILGSINSTPRASGSTQYQLLNSNITLPAEVWIATGNVIIDASGSAQMSTSTLTLYKDSSYICLDGSKSTADQHYLIFSGSVTSDGTNVISAVITGTTSTAVTFNPISGDCFLYLTRIA